MLELVEAQGAAVRAGRDLGPEAACVPVGRRCNIAEQSCQRELFGIVQCLYGTTEGARPVVRFVSTEALARESRTNEERLAREDAALESFARQLGLSEASDKEVDTRVAGDPGPNAYYSAAKGEILIVRRAAVPTDGELAWLVLAHEYVHALQNRRGALERALRSRQERSFDRDLALFAAFEGEAALYEQILRALHHGQRPERWVLPRFEAETGASDDAVLGQSRLLESSFGSFPYSYGAHWAARRWLAAPSERLESRFVPASTYEFLARRHDWAPQRAATHEPRRVASAWPACAARRRSLPGHVRAPEESVGAWLIQAFVRKQTRSVRSARSVASAARGDSLCVYAGRSDTPSFVWRTLWATPSAAQTMSSLLEGQLGASTHAARFAVRGDGRAVVAVVLDPRAGSLSADAIASSEVAAFAGSPPCPATQGGASCPSGVEHLFEEDTL
jgi:hypothetical protein